MAIDGAGGWQRIQAQAIAEVTAAAAVLEGKIVAVTDGDTIKVLDVSKVEHMVCLSAIDAPERKMAFGQRSKQHLSDLVYGRWVEVEGHKLIATDAWWAKSW